MDQLYVARATAALFLPHDPKDHAKPLEVELAELDAGQVSDDRITKDESESSGICRSRSMSWQQLPQAQRGITLGELWNFYHSRQEWLEELRWCCDACRSTWSAVAGPCPKCQGSSGQLRKRNLYEVVAHMVKPIVESEGISYVEYLGRQRKGQPGRDIDSFVSHYWGEEFPNFLATLDRYARVRCAGTGYLYSVMFLVVAFFGFCHWAISPAAQCDFPPLRGGGTFFDLFYYTPQGARCWLWAFLDSVIIVISWTVAWLLVGRTQRDPLSWSFWICAFANNQYAIEHAVPEGCDVSLSSFAVALRAECCSDMVAVLGRNCELYTRIWCVFELFFSSVVLPRRFGRDIPIALANEKGIVSYGDADPETMREVDRMIEEINIGAATSSIEKDQVVIRECMEKEHTTNSNVEALLSDFAIGGMVAAECRGRSILALSLLGPICMSCACLMLHHFSSLIRLLLDDGFFDSCASRDDDRFRWSVPAAQPKSNGGTCHGPLWAIFNYRETRAFTINVFVYAFVLVFAGIGLLYLMGHWKGVHCRALARARKRVLLLLAIYCLPAMIMSASYILTLVAWHALQHRKDNPSTLEINLKLAKLTCALQRFSLVVASNTITSIFGLVLGVLYWRSRSSTDVRIVTLRRLVEDRLFN